MSYSIYDSIDEFIGNDLEVADSLINFIESVKNGIKKNMEEVDEDE